MTDLGPVEYIVVGFADGALAGAVAPALLDLVETGQVRVVDLVVVAKDAQGRVAITEMEELPAEAAGAFARLRCTVSGLLSEADLDDLGAELAPDSAAVVMLVEHLWAARFAGAVRAAGGELRYSERIPHAVVAQARATLQDLSAE
jgi:hypothetical protein